ncbi:MAG TPA: GNAT family N-acetyltransferase [Dokdonella sp.]
MAKSPHSATGPYRSATRPPRRRKPQAPAARTAPAGEPLLAHDGRPLCLRAIQPDDAAALRRAFTRLTPEQVRARFFYRMNELSEALAARLSDPDPETTAAFVVVDAEASETPGEIRGEARLHADQATASAEFAIAIDPAFTAQGLGRALMLRLARECRERGLVELWGDVLADNYAMLDFTRHLGLSSSIEHGDEAGVVRVRFALA